MSVEIAGFNCRLRLDVSGFRSTEDCSLRAAGMTSIVVIGPEGVVSALAHPVADDPSCSAQKSEAGQLADCRPPSSTVYSSYMSTPAPPAAGAPHSRPHQASERRLVGEELNS
jgi:hypothetical protein